MIFEKREKEKVEIGKTTRQNKTTCICIKKEKQNRNKIR